MMIRKVSARTLCAVIVLLCCSAFAQQRPELKGAKGTIPVGTVLNVRVTENLTSETAQPGDIFHGTLQEDVEVNGRIIFPRGSDVTGRVTDAQSSGRLSAPGILELTLTSIEASNVTAKIVTEPLKMQGESHTKSNATKIGAGAAAGAIIGAIAGGGKGAAIGTVVGGAAGTGAAAATGKREATVESEAILSWTTSVDALSVSKSAGQNASATEDIRSYDDQVHLTPRTTSKPAGTPVQSSTPVSSAANEPVPEFSARDRRVLRSCLTSDTGELPPGLAKMEQLPAGQEKQIAKNGTLPPGVARRAQALPLACESQLPKLPSNLERVILNRQVLLINTDNRILDIATLD